MNSNLNEEILSENFGRRNFLRTVGLASLALPLLSGTSKTSPEPGSMEDISELIRLFNIQIKKEFLAAALKEGIKVDQNSIAIGISPAGIIINAAIKGLATLDLIRYEKGVQTNFIYVDSKATSLKTGFYVVTSVVEKVILGRVSIKAQYSQDGKLIETSSGVAQVGSLRVPANVNAQAPVKMGMSITQPLDKGHETDPLIVITAVCPNGGNSSIELPRSKR